MNAGRSAPGRYRKWLLELVGVDSDLQGNVKYALEPRRPFIMVLRGVGMVKEGVSFEL